MQAGTDIEHGNGMVGANLHTAPTADAFCRKKLFRHRPRRPQTISANRTFGEFCPDDPRYQQHTGHGPGQAEKLAAFHRFMVSWSRKRFFPETDRLGDVFAVWQAERLVFCVKIGQTHIQDHLILTYPVNEILHVFRRSGFQYGDDITLFIVAKDLDGRHGRKDL
jgi:hypothetical protein